jgi:hypothetical protein
MRARLPGQLGCALYQFGAAFVVLVGLVRKHSDNDAFLVRVPDRKANTSSMDLFSVGVREWTRQTTRRSVLTLLMLMAVGMLVGWLGSLFGVPGPGLVCDLVAFDPADLSDRELVEVLQGWERLTSWSMAVQLEVSMEFARRRDGTVTAMGDPVYGWSWPSHGRGAAADPPVQVHRK